MKRSVYLNIVIIIFLVAGILFFFARNATLPNSNRNGIERLWLSDGGLTPKTLLKFSLPVNDLISVSNSYLFCSGPSPQWLFRINVKDKKVDTFLLELPGIEHFEPPFKTYITNNRVFVHSNNHSTVFAGNFSIGSFQKIKLSNSIFTKSVQITDTTVLIRGFEDNKLEQSFKLVNIRLGQVKVNNKLFTGQSDAGFGDDGIMIYNNEAKKVVYVRYFRNGIFCLDTNLNLIYSKKTIDTIIGTVANYEVKKGQLLSTAPRVKVNSRAVMNDQFIMIQSALIADNESQKDFNNYTALDVYRLNDGKYVGSFHLREKSQNIQSLLLYDTNLFVLCRSGLKVLPMSNIINKVESITK